jgi:hypothetical protein
METTLPRDGSGLPVCDLAQEREGTDALREREARRLAADERITIELCCLPTDEPEEWDLVPNFEDWMDRSLSEVLMDTFWTWRGEWYFGNRRIRDEDFAYPLWSVTTRWDRMKNDLALWDTLPHDYLHADENIVRHLYAFAPDRLDWSRLRSVSRTEWHRVVEEYYRLDHQIETGPSESGFKRNFAVLNGWLDRNGRRLIDLQNRLYIEWCPRPNALRERRLRLYPEIAVD